MKKKVLLLFLSLFVTAQMYAQLGEGPQIPNNDFETWDNSGSNIEPQHWSSLMTANVTVYGGSAGQQQVVFKETTNLPPNTTGNSCAKLKSKQISILGFITVTANGNMTTGRINMGATSPTETKTAVTPKRGTMTLVCLSPTVPILSIFGRKLQAVPTMHVLMLSSIMMY